MFPELIVPWQPGNRIVSTRGVENKVEDREAHNAPPAVTPMRLLRGFGVFLGWLSGSLVGITALFYAIGFLASITALSFFGLNIFLLGYDTLVYLARGANALMFFTLELGRVLIILSPLIAIYPLLRRGAAALKTRLQGPIEKIPFHGPLSRSWRGALYGLLFIYMYFILDRYIPQFNQYLGVEGVLQRPSPLPTAADPWVRNLLCGDGNQLRTNFLILGIVTLLAALVTLWALSAHTKHALPANDDVSIPGHPHHVRLHASRGVRRHIPGAKTFAGQHGGSAGRAQQDTLSHRAWLGARGPMGCCNFGLSFFQVRSGRNHDHQSAGFDPSGPPWSQDLVHG